MTKRAYISFRAFFLIWAQMQGWNVPDFHLKVCDWLERRGRKAVIKVFRGGAKSTILAIYQAWKLRDHHGYRFLDRSADDGTAVKLSADTKHIIERHPICRGMIKGKKGVERFSVEHHPDIRNASVTAYGIMSNATSSRADEIINDDTEVPKNIQTPDTRRTLRERLSEETHIITPGGKILYVGTDHTHNSIYDEKIKDGYESLIIPLFSSSMRVISDGHTTVFRLDFSVKDKDLYVMAGIGRYARVFEDWQYEIEPGDNGTIVRLHEAVEEGNTIDFAAGNVWPERFNRAEILFRRQECKTLNAWDSQYMLQARPVHEIRLDPDRLVVYSETPKIRFANGAVSMMLGSQLLTGCRAVWDCSLGKADSDDSVFEAMFQDTAGHLYWHVLDVLKGDPFEQCRRVAERVAELQIPGVTVLTRGVGGFLPAILRRVFAEQRIQCAVKEKVEKQNKSDKILGAFEPALAAGILHAHRSVLENGLAEQMRDWIPGKQNQPDDFLDAGSESILEMPVKIGRVVKVEGPLRERSEWRQYSGTYEVQTTF